MLATQISYWAMKENQRHNLVTEEQGKVDLQRKEREYQNQVTRTTNDLNIAKANLAEAIRHNKVAEGNDKLKSQAAVSQAQAALRQAEVAAFNAETNLKKVKSEIALNKSQIKVNSSVKDLNKSAAALNRANISTVGYRNANLASSTKKNIADIGYTQAKTSESKAGAAYTKEKTKTAKKDNKYYVMNNVVPNTARSAKDVITSVASAIAPFGKGMTTGTNVSKGAAKSFKATTKAAKDWKNWYKSL